MMAGAVSGGHVERFASFRQRAPFLSEAEYSALYSDYPRVLDESDNSEACIKRVLRDLIGPSVCDVGCGTGYLLKRAKQARTDLQSLTGIDLSLGEIGAPDGITFLPGRVEALPFPDKSFDTVVCTHTIEHVLDHKAAITELRRMAARRLIIIVPREREYKYTFNPHLHFFPYAYSFLRAMQPVPSAHVCIDIQRDIYYCEDR